MNIPNPNQDVPEDLINEIVHRYFSAMERALLRAIKQAFSRQEVDTLPANAPAQISQTDTVPDLPALTDSSAHRK